MQAVAADSQVGLDEIIVTARRRAESLQDTPISITALSAETMEARNIVSLADVSRAAPNLIFDAGTGNTGGATNAQVFIRGIGQTDFLFTTDPGVGIYVDEVYYPRAVGAVLELADFDRIEVLRGPQGTLFGKNTIGGALNITTRRPGDEFGGSVEVTAGSRERLDGRATLDLPISADFGFRLSAISRSQDGYVERVTAGDGALGDVNMIGGRVVAEWTPSNDWSALFAADVTRRRESALANEGAAVGAVADNPLLFLWNTFVAPAYGALGPYDSRYISAERETQGTAPVFSDLDSWGASLTLTHAMGDLELKSITAYREHEALFGSDVDHSPLPYLDSDNDNVGDNFSQELQLSGESFGGRLNWVTGAYYFHENGRDLFNIRFANGLYAALEALPGAIFPLDPGAVCPPPPGPPQPCAGGAGNPLNALFDLDATILNDIDITSMALYGQGTFRLTDRLSVTAGLRYTDEEKELLTSFTRNQSGIVSVPNTTLNASWNSVSPRLGLEYAMNDDVLLYASAARGFKGGGFNGRATQPEQLTTFDPELVWSYEGGFKSEWFDNRLRLNGAVYWSDYTGMQLTSVRDVGGLIVAITENAGESRIRGFELELDAQVTERLRISGGLGYTDSEFTELSPGATVTFDSAFSKVPDWTANMAATLDVPIDALGILSLSGDVSYRSEYFNDVPNSPIAFEDGVTLLGLRATLRPETGPWQLAVFGTNLTDARYITNSLNSYGSFGTADRTYGRPQEWGVSLSARF